MMNEITRMRTDVMNAVFGKFVLKSTCSSLHSEAYWGWGGGGLGYATIGGRCEDDRARLSSIGLVLFPHYLANLIHAPDSVEENI